MIDRRLLIYIRRDQISTNFEEQLWIANEPLNLDITANTDTKAS